MDTGTTVYRNHISPDPIFLTTKASSVGRFYAISSRGQVLLATVNEATIVPFVSGQVIVFLMFEICFVLMNLLLVFLQLNNLELAVNLAKRGNLLGAENLVSICTTSL